jgi:hypothetical protein
LEIIVAKREQKFISVTEPHNFYVVSASGGKIYAAPPTALAYIFKESKIEALLNGCLLCAAFFLFPASVPGLRLCSENQTYSTLEFEYFISS